MYKMIYQDFIMRIYFLRRAHIFLKLTAQDCYLHKLILHYTIESFLYDYTLTMFLNYQTYISYGLVLLLLFLHIATIKLN